MNKLSNRLILVCAFVWIFPGLAQAQAQAQVTGIWNTTGLTRVDVSAIKSPGLVPGHTVEIDDGTYDFNVNGSFTAGAIVGTWTQKKNQYAVTVSRVALENLYRQRLEETPGLIVNQIKLVKTKVSGSQFDNGLWGNESYEYRTDTTFNGRREVLKVVMTVHVAAASKQVVSLETPDVNAFEALPKHSSIDAAAAAVVNYLSRQ